MLAYVRPPGASFAECALTFLEREGIDLDLARQQHAGFVAALREDGVEVRELPALDDAPDACFVEDVALLLDGVAVIARPALESRRAELPAIEEALAADHELLRMESPATLEGGDVIAIDGTLYVGQSGRTNHPGLKQLAHLVLEHGYRVKAAGVRGCLHLQTAATRVGEDLLLVNPAWVDLHRMRGVRGIEVHPDEPFAACALWTGKRVLHPEGFPRTRERLERAGVEVVSLPLGEFQKAEAGPTCLTLRTR